MIWRKKSRYQYAKQTPFVGSLVRQSVTKWHYIRYFILSALFLGFGLLGHTQWAIGAEGATFSGFAKTITATFVTLQKIMVVAAYAAGVGFAIIGLLKFKAHKDNPAQIPLSTPIALIAVSAGLLFMPTVFEIAGDAVFGKAAKKSPSVEDSQTAIN